ncbi:2-amino-4-hydroxy-6-hydroxymethyldihydropteridine diphosphokinase [Sphingomonas sp.]|uniref:2-amino-4-hydroxy-6- hydroxymethyldihydropteridine diphosphokinase n=1 Tax=Sphingomonas sp. TaxID=28214 RepID=UPI002CAE5F18|nr:2-amino-4-hydroxy-6-hydroxymethyldihydropteridine diphosphokinase [Sphingomonas sp.]HWK35505.1 2-amino-4-hydroxy-6-hydroxymethyldihydropteridine diphosphokinase [Sphingomonas sp.]
MRAALALLDPVAVSRVITSAPMGPSLRRYANAAAIIESAESPDALLRRLKAIERDFGRRRGRRWGARVIDLDIILWSGGAWRGPGLIVPHIGFRDRGFVLGPLAAIAPAWRDPVSGLTVRHLLARLCRPRALAEWARSSVGRATDF